MIGRKPIAAAALVALVLALTGCGESDTRESCEARGGEWRSTTIYIPQKIGNVTVPMPITTWSCEGGNR